MKNIILAFVAIFAITSIAVAQESNDSKSLSEPVETGENYEVYGSEFPDDAQFFALGYLIRNSDVFQDQKIATSGTIKQVCQKKGCFFILTDEDGEEHARITFKDYEFFIPTNTAGKEVRLVGTFDVKELSEDEAKHYAEDVEEDPDEVEGQQVEFQIEASAVKIFD